MSTQQQLFGFRDIPVVNIDRAIQWYQSVLNVKLDKKGTGEHSVALFPYTDDCSGGCLTKSDHGVTTDSHSAALVKPSENGIMQYLNVEGRLAQATKAAEANGGKVVQAAQSIGPHGFRSLVHDSEGNLVALHSYKEDTEEAQSVKEPHMKPPHPKGFFPWQEIPVDDLDRAVKFYNAITGMELKKMEEYHFAVFPTSESAPGGLLTQTGKNPLHQYKVSSDGVLVYFKCDGRLQQAVAKAEENGGKLIEGIKSIGHNGFRAVILDSEGNRIALWSKL